MDKSEKIKQFEKELNELKKEQEEFNKLSPAKQLAEKLHEALCIHNHTDGCSWYYGSWENIENSYERKRYLGVAERLLKITDEETVLKIIGIIKSL